MQQETEYTRPLLPSDDESLIKPYPAAARLDTIKPPPAVSQPPPAVVTISVNRRKLIIAAIVLGLLFALGTGFWLGSYNASRNLPPPAPITVQMPPAVAMPDFGTGPFRPRISTSIGDGLLSHVSYSDSLYPFSDDFIDSRNPQLQHVRNIDNISCDSSRYDVEQIWFVAAAPAAVTVNNRQVLQLEHSTIPQGYIIDIPLRKGDYVCVNNGTSSTPPPIYYLLWGPSTNPYYDSYCYRGNCTIGPQLEEAERKARANK